MTQFIEVPVITDDGNGADVKPTVVRRLYHVNTILSVTPRYDSELEPDKPAQVRMLLLVQHSNQSWVNVDISYAEFVAQLALEELAARFFSKPHEMLLEQVTKNLPKVCGVRELEGTPNGTRVSIDPRTNKFVPDPNGTHEYLVPMPRHQEP